MEVGIQSLFGRVSVGKHCVKGLCSPENEDGEAALDLSATAVKTWPEPVKRAHASPHFGRVAWHGRPVPTEGIRARNMEDRFSCPGPAANPRND